MFVIKFQGKNNNTKHTATHKKKKPQAKTHKSSINRKPKIKSPCARKKKTTDEGRKPQDAHAEGKEAI